MTIHCTTCGRTVRQPAHGKYEQCASCRDANWLAWERAGKPEKWPPDPTPDEQPTTTLRHCANTGCVSQGGRRALISRLGGHDLCTLCQKQARIRMLVAAGKYTDWPGSYYGVSDLEMQTRRDYRGFGYDLIA